MALEEEMLDHQPSGSPHRNGGHQQATGDNADLGSTLRGMEEQLLRHSALEDLGPLFGPEAQGKQPSSPPATPSDQP